MAGFVRARARRTRLSRDRARRADRFDGRFRRDRPLDRSQPALPLRVGPGRRELRLERQLGAEAYVLARAPAPVADDQPHELALQVAGFRVQAFLDDVLVVQVLDGAIGRGGFGCWSSGDAVRWQSLASTSPVPAVASSALVGEVGEARLVTATAVAAGHLHVLQLAGSTARMR